MNAITKPAPAGEVADYGDGLLNVIANAARDPNVDIDKMERLLAMQERFQERNAEIAYSQALADMQPELPSISMNGAIVHKGQTISEYAEWSDVSKAITPVLSRFGFSLSFKPTTEGNHAKVTAVLRHRAGYKEEATLSLPSDTSGAKNAVQAIGSSLTYAKRYTAVLLLNIRVEGEDDDGAKAAPKVVHEAPRDRPFPQGPARNKTDLQAKGRELWREIEACGDETMLDVLLSDNRDLLEQLKEALPSWWTGYQKDGESYPGLEAVIARVRRETQA